MKKQCFYFVLLALTAFFAFLSACGEGTPINLDGTPEVGKINGATEDLAGLNNAAAYIKKCLNSSTYTTEDGEVHDCPDISQTLPPPPPPSSEAESSSSSATTPGPGPSSSGTGTSSATVGSSSSAAGVSSSSVAGGSSSSNRSSSSVAGSSSSNRSSSSVAASSSSRASSSSVAVSSSSRASSSSASGGTSSGSGGGSWNGEVTAQGVGYSVGNGTISVKCSACNDQAKVSCKYTKGCTSSATVSASVDGGTAISIGIDCGEHYSGNAVDLTGVVCGGGAAKSVTFTGINSSFEFKCGCWW